MRCNSVVVYLYTLNYTRYRLAYFRGIKKRTVNKKYVPTCTGVYSRIMCNPNFWPNFRWKKGALNTRLYGRKNNYLYMYVRHDETQRNKKINMLHVTSSLPTVKKIVRTKCTQGCYDCSINIISTWNRELNKSHPFDYNKNLSYYVKCIYSICNICITCDIFYLIEKCQIFFFLYGNFKFFEHVKSFSLCVAVWIYPHWNARKTNTIMWNWQQIDKLFFVKFSVRKCDWHRF